MYCDVYKTERFCSLLVISEIMLILSMLAHSIARMLHTFCSACQLNNMVREQNCHVKLVTISDKSHHFFSCIGDLTLTLKSVVTTWIKQRLYKRGKSVKLPNIIITFLYYCRIIVRLFAESPNVNYWIGLRDISHSGSWQWVNGRPAAWNDGNLWRVGEPNGFGRENCANMRVNSLLVNDLNCGYDLRGVCEKSI